MHATWNVLVKVSADPLAMNTRATVVSAAIITPPALVIWWLAGRPGLPVAAWPVLVASAIAEVAYFDLLSRAYRSGDISIVYPIARGLGPVIAIAGGLLLLGERLSRGEAIGVAALVGGIWLVRGGSLRWTPGTLPALFTGVMIGTYTILDRVGVRLASPWLFGWLLWIAIALGLAAWTRGRPLVRADVDWRSSTIVGLLQTATYFLILFALSIAPVALVSPVRESAIVIVTFWGIWRLRERSQVALRVVGAVAIVAGITLIALP
jgi:drug/metabolite transporter (DMT)-like permease